MLAGDDGAAVATAMRILVAIARLQDAPHFIPVASGHIDSCLYHGQAGLDFAERLAADGARVRVPTTLNVSSLDLLHPERFRGDEQTAVAARRLMDAYVAMGCRPTWTCAPYQLPFQRPAAGTDVAWAESNAIVFVNSVLGARTDRYGDFVDICAAVTGRVPYAGLHRPEARRGGVVFDVGGLPDAALREPVVHALIGHVVGARSGTRVPVVDGLPSDTTEDMLKALGAAAASSGSVALFHAVGVTPEAATLGDALQGEREAHRVEVTTAMLREAQEQLTTSTATELSAVALGTPHASLAELTRLGALTDGPFRVPVYVNTGRDVLAAAADQGIVAPLEEAGVRFVTDTCTYITPVLDVDGGVVMTDSAKWAYYAPGNVGAEVVLGTMADCVASARAGRVTITEQSWS